MGEGSGPIPTECGTQCTRPCKQMGPVDVNGGVDTARKQHQRKNVPICACNGDDNDNKKNTTAMTTAR